MQNFDSLKFGCIIPDELKPTIRFSDIRTKITDERFEAALLWPKSSSDKNFKPLSSWKVLGNDRYNNSAAVTWANTRRIVTARWGESEAYPTLEQTLAFYMTQNPRFGPNRPSPRADQGMSLQDSLDHLVKHGGADGQKAVAFARVDPTNREEVSRALAVFGSLWIGFRVYEHNQTEYQEGKPWTPPADPHNRSWGHAVMCYGDFPNFEFVTWGNVQRFSETFWTGFPNVSELAQPIFEAYVVVWPEHIGTRPFMAGVNLAQLRQEYEKLVSHPIKVPSLNFDSLFFRATNRTTSGMVEIKKIDPSASYGTISVDAVTSVSTASGFHGAWVADNDDICYIQQTCTGSGRVEISWMSKDQGYTDFDHHAIVSSVHTSNRPGVTWKVDNGDLYGIKTWKTKSGMVEILWMKNSRLDDPISFVTGLDLKIGRKTYAIRGGDLYMIVHPTSYNNFAEIYRLKRDQGYSKHSIECWVTGFTDNSDLLSGDMWSIGTNGDLYVIKSRKTNTRLVEIYIVTAESGYRTIKSYSTPIRSTNRGIGFI